MAVTIQKGSTSAYFTVQQPNDVARPYGTNDYDLVPAGDGIHLSLIHKYSKADNRILINNEPYTNIINGDTASVFVDYASCQAYILANFFRNAGGSGGSYTLPVATNTILGGVKQGSGVTIAGDGTLSTSGATPAWGSITGTLSSQTDLNNALNLKANLTDITLATPTPMIDGLSNVQVAYGLVRLKTGASKCIRLRRGADNIEQDFYFTTFGTLDVPVIVNWLNGSTGYVKTWYDQSGNGVDATQSTTTLQPFLVFEDVPKIRYQFSGINTGQALTFTLGSSITANNASVFAGYRAVVASAASSFNPAIGGYVSQKSILGGASTNFEIYLGDTSPDYDAIRIASGGTIISTVNLYGYNSPNYISLQSGSSSSKVTSNYKAVTLGTLGAGTETTLTIGNSAAGLNPFAGDFFNFILFNTNVADATITSLATLSKSAFNLVDSSTAILNICCEGDSQTAGISATNNQNYPSQMRAGKNNWILDTGIAGNFIADITLKAVHVDRNIVAGKTNVLFVWIGTNDIAGGTTGATEYSNLVTYCNARKTAGWNKVYVLTMIQGSAPGSIETQRLAYNTAIRGNGNVNWDGVVDIGSDPRFQYYQGALSVYTYNTMYQSDGIHPSNAGYALIASYCDAVIDSLNTTPVTTNLLSRLANIESSINQLPLSFTSNSNSFSLALNNVAVGGTAYLPSILGGTKPNTTVTIQGTTAAGGGNQGKTIIEPGGGSFSVGGTGFTGAFTAKSAGTYYINWLTGSSNQVIMSFNGAAGGLGTENLSSYQSGYTIGFDGVNTMRLYSPNYMTLSAFGLTFQNASGAAIGSYTNSGNWGIGTIASTTNPLTFSGSYNGIGTTTPIMFNSTVSYGPTNPSVGSTLVYNGYNLSNTFNATAVGTVTPAVVTGNNFVTTISQPAAYTFTSINGVNEQTIFNHTIGIATMTTYTGNWLQTKSTSSQNVSATTFYGTRVTPFNKASTGTLSGTTGYGLYIDDWSGAGLFTNQYAIYSANTSPSVLSGNLSLPTIPISNHTIFAPTTGGTVTLISRQENIINPAGTLATLTIALPSSPLNNDVVYITFTQAITSITYSGGTVVGSPSSATLGGQWHLTYDSATTTWY